MVHVLKMTEFCCCGQRGEKTLMLVVVIVDTKFNLSESIQCREDSGICSFGQSGEKMDLVFVLIWLGCC